MFDFKKIIPAISSTFKIGSSIGQTYFGLRHVGEYLFKSKYHVGTHSITAVAILGGLGVNLIARVPANFRYFSKHATSKTAKQPIKLSILASMIKYLLKTSAHLSGTFTGLNAYFGTIMLSEYIAELLNSDAYDENWKFYLIQSASLVSAGVAIANYYSYDYGLLSENAEMIAENVELRHFPWNKNTAKTISLTSFNLVAAPVLAYFWTEPAVLKIPIANNYLEGTGTLIINIAASSSAFFSTSATIPSIYNSFAGTAKDEVPSTSLSKALLAATIVTGGVDSIASGSCTFIGIVDTGYKLAQINPYGLIIMIAIPCGISAGANNALFVVRNGYYLLIQDLYPKHNSEAAPLLDEEKNSTKVSTYNQKNLGFTIYGSFAETRQQENDQSDSILTINHVSGPSV